MQTVCFPDRGKTTMREKLRANIGVIKLEKLYIDRKFRAGKGLYRNALSFCPDFHSTYRVLKGRIP